MNLSIEEDLLVRLRHIFEFITKIIEVGDKNHESIKKIFEKN